MTIFDIGLTIFLVSMGSVVLTLTAAVFFDISLQRLKNWWYYETHYVGDVNNVDDTIIQPEIRPARIIKSGVILRPPKSHKKMPLELEIATYEARLPELLVSSRDQWVVIKDGTVLGIYQNIEDAFHVGYHAYGVTSFLVRQILEKQPVVFISGLWPVDNN